MMDIRSYVDGNAAMVHRNPSKAQKEAGNYRKGHIRVHGLEIAIENTRGSSRHGVDHDGYKWSVKMPAHYGYIKGTEGADSDHVDVYLGPHLKSSKVFVIDQNDADNGKFDEHKAFLGFGNANQVRATYRKAFSDGRADERLGHIHEMTIDHFKDWLKSGDQSRPIKRARGGRVSRADGGNIPDFDPSQPFEDASVPAFDSTKPFTAAPEDGNGPNDFSWSQSITDIPSEIGNAASEAWNTVAGGPSRSELGPVEGILNTGKRALGVGSLLMSPLTGAYRSLIGHPMANLEHAAGTVINPDVAARDDPAAMYSTAKGDADLAMSALAARKPIAPTIAPTVLKPSTIGDFDVPLTVGESTGDFSKIAEERAALRGGRGERAQDVAQNFIDERSKALENARQGIGKDLDRFGQNIVQDPQDAGALVSDAVRNAAAAAKSRASGLYENAFDLPGEIHAGAFEGIANRIKGDLSLGDNPVIIDDKTTPVASQALQDIENNIDRLKVQNRADPFGQPDPQNIVGINLRGVDQTRKRLVQFINDAKKYPPDADTRATQAVLNAFDNQVEDAISRGLFSGDDRALQYLKDARSAYSQYRRDFTPQGSGDDVGRAMQKILGRGVDGQQATPTEVANYLYGSANVGSKGLSVRLSQRLRNILGEDSPEWTGVRQGLWSRLTQSTEGRTDWGPQKVSERISEFLNGSGKPLAESMFSPAERQVMTRYSNLLKQMVPPQGSVNYSNNLPMLNRIADGLDKHVGTVIGAKIGGVPGAVAGYAAGKGTSAANSFMNARRTARLMPTIQQSMKQWQRAQALAARGKMPSTPAVLTASANLAKALSQVGFDYVSTLRGLQGAITGRAQDEQQ